MSRHTSQFLSVDPMETFCLDVSFSDILAGCHLAAASTLSPLTFRAAAHISSVKYHHCHSLSAIGGTSIKVAVSFVICQCDILVSCHLAASSTLSLLTFRAAAHISSVKYHHCHSLSADKY